MAFAAPGLSGSTAFTYNSENAYSNSTSLDYAMPMAGPISMDVALSVGITDGAISAGWPTFTMAYSLANFTISGSLNSLYKVKLAYVFNAADYISVTPSIYYTDAVVEPLPEEDGDPAIESSNLVGAIALAKGTAFIPALAMSGTFTATEIIDSVALAVAGAVAFKIGDVVYVKPYINAGYNFTTETENMNGGLKAGFMPGLDFNFNYVFIANTWALSATISF
jgi:hypothetical protein